MTNNIEVQDTSSGCSQIWYLWQCEVANSDLPAVLYLALQTFNRARVNERVIYTRSDAEA